MDDASLQVKKSVAAANKACVVLGATTNHSERVRSSRSKRAPTVSAAR
jgi:hypothetical protein